MHLNLKMLCGTISGLMLLTACATTSLVDSWRSADLAEHHYRYILVANLLKNDTFRQISSEGLVTELTGHGVKTVVADALLLTESREERTRLYDAARGSHHDGLIIIETVATEKRTTIYPDRWYPYSYPFYYDSYYSRDPVYTVTYATDTIQVTLFDVATDRVVWAGAIEIPAQGKPLTAARDLAGIIVDSLVAEGML